MPNSIDIGTYEKVPISEEWPSSFPSSASDEASDDMPMLPGSRPSRTRRVRWRLSNCCSRSPMLYLLDVLLIGLSIFVYIRYWPSTRSSRLDSGADITGYVPKFPTEVVTFQARPEYISNHTSVESLQEAREHWMKLVPPGQGFIQVDRETAEKYGMPNPILYKGGLSVGTSSMHALHCLYVIMAEYDLLAQGLKSLPLETVHMDHCIDYVRQVVMCGGDMALAGEDLPNGSSQLNVPHVCKSWDKMYDWLYERRDNDAWQFGHEETQFVPL